MKLCSGCKKYLDETKFNTHNKKKDGLNSFCKSCSGSYCKKHYKENHNNYLSRNQKFRKKNLELFTEYLRGKYCVDCGIDDPRLLEFDHLRDKRAEISYLIKNVSWDTVLTEIDKCEIVCCNCHRIRSIKRGNWWRNSLMV